MVVYSILTDDVVEPVTRVLYERELTDQPLVVTRLGQGSEALDQAARVPADVLILDMCTGPALGPAVIRYRLARPNTRIILLAIGSMPGDPNVAMVVQAQVYDVVTDVAKLGDVFDAQPAGLAAAVKWLDPSLAPEAEKIVQVRERVIERRVPMTQRPVYITVAGAAAGVGTTTAACALATFLAKRGYKTVLVDAAPYPSLQVVTGLQLAKDPVAWKASLEVCKNENPLDLVRARQHQYIIADFGERSAVELMQIDADLTLVVIPPEQRIFRTVAWLKQPDKAEDRQQVYYFLRQVVYLIFPENAAREAASAWDAIWHNVFDYVVNNADGAVEPLIHCLPMCGITDAVRINQELEAACSDILKDVLPTEIQKGFSRSFGRVFSVFGTLTVGAVVAYLLYLFFRSPLQDILQRLH